ncbi:MAG: nucleotidyl transferase AbiEii/AbiGii toxin family protein [Verrucomicrobiota bacterium]
MILSSDLREFIELLNSQRVEFVIVGAHALAWHGLPRYTKDIDFLVGTSDANRERLTKVIDAFGFASTGLSADDFATPDQVIQLGLEPNRIDLLTGISGVDWTEAWETRVAGNLDGLPVSYLGKEAYIKNKLASGRPQDQADAARLQEIIAKDDT